MYRITRACEIVKTFCLQMVNEQKYEFLLSRMTQADIKCFIILILNCLTIHKIIQAWC